MLRFSSPWFLTLLLLIPIAAVYRHRRHRPASLAASALFFVGKMPVSLASRLSPLVPVLKYAALFLMVIALSRPQWGTERTEVITTGVNIILAIDLSESMAALDFKRQGQVVNRLEAVKGVVQEFVANRRADRIGMVVFGTHAYTQLPLTQDYTALSTLLGRLNIGAAGERTAIGDAIGISIKRLSDIESRSNIIILLTDGQDNAGDLSPDIAADIAAANNIKIYTIGAGTRGKAPFRVNHPILGDRYVYQQVDIDEDTLKAIARKTGGLYFRAEDLDGLRDVYATIDKLEKSEAMVEVFSDARDLYPFLLIPAVLMMMAWGFLRSTRYLVVP
ncbi:VWA domain-containing protein [Desulfosarcina sp. OttesenSCG-928-B08]|nr:VWA domain-containing protein [Desulfosarcina sp. OttesenSCG-928-B08]